MDNMWCQQEDDFKKQVFRVPLIYIHMYVYKIPNGLNAMLKCDNYIKMAHPAPIGHEALNHSGSICYIERQQVHTIRPTMNN